MRGTGFIENLRALLTDGSRLAANRARRTADGRGVVNLFGYHDPAVDALIERHDAARTDTAAQDAYHELHARLAEELPYLFLQGEVDIGPLGAVVDLGWSDIELGGQDMSMLDASAMLTFEPAAFVELHAGYRLKSFEGTAGGGPDRRAVDLTTRGFFVGGGFSF